MHTFAPLHEYWHKSPGCKRPSLDGLLTAPSVQESVLSTADGHVMIHKPLTKTEHHNLEQPHQ